MAEAGGRLAAAGRPAPGSAAAAGVVPPYPLVARNRYRPGSATAE